MMLPALKLAAVLVPPAITVPITIVIALALMWYWMRLGRPEVPNTRRTIRRFTILIALITLPIVLNALSIINPQTSPRQFMIAWTVVVLLMIVLMLIAIVDMMNNFRIHHRQLEGDLRNAAEDFAEAVRRRQQEHQEKGAGEESDEENAENPTENDEEPTQRKDRST
ncbi:MAG: hypothetical protein EA377_11095 [Phycisphaerales bacterium]|nr:MAG: hypothetical protein EA377_11095 [Phycisphaerales bacterium]